MIQPGSAPIELPFTTPGSSRAVQEIKRVTGALGKADRAADQIGPAFRSMGRSVGAALATLAAGAVAAGVAIGAVVRLGREVVAFGMRGGDVSAVSAAFERLGDPALLGRLVEVTGHLVRETELMERSTQVLRTGIVGADEWVDMSAAVVRAAQDMGRDVSSSLASVATALSGGGMESLATLGVNVFELRERLTTMNLTMETSQGRLVAVRLALQQMQSDMGEINNSASSLSDTWTTLSVQTGSYYDRVAEGFAESEGLVVYFEKLRVGIEATLPPGESMATLLVSIAAATLEATTATAAFVLLLARGVKPLSDLVAAFGAVGFAVPRFVARLVGIEMPAHASVRAAAGLDSMIDALQTTVDVTSVAVEGMNERLSQTATEAAEAERGMTMMKRATDDLTSSVAGLGAATREIDRDILGELFGMSIPSNEVLGAQASGGSGDDVDDSEVSGRSGGGRRRAEEEEWRQIVEENAQFEAALHNQRVKAADEESALRRRIMEEQTLEMQRERELQELRMGNVEDRIRAEMGLSEKRADAAREEMEIIDAASEASREHNSQMVEQTTGMIGSVAGLALTVTSALKAQAGGSKEAAKAEGVFLVAYNSVMAAVELAKGIAAFASQKYASGALHLVAMTSFITAAALAGSQLGGGAASTPVASGASFAPVEQSEDSERGKDTGTTVYINYSLSRSGAELGQVMERASYQRERSQLRSRRPVGIDFE